VVEIWTFTYSIIYFILFCRSNDGVKGRQAKDLEEMDKEDYMGSERNGMLNGPVPDVDTLEIGITRKEMGELLNCMKQNNMFVLFITFLKTIRVYSGCRLCLLMIKYYYIKKPVNENLVPYRGQNYALVCKYTQIQSVSVINYLSIGKYKLP